MNAIATVVGYIVMGLTILLVLAVAVGKFFDRKRDYKPEFEDWDPAPRASVTPLVLSQWRRDDSTRDTPTPSDPAS